MSETLQEDMDAVIAELEKKCEQHPDSVMAHHHVALVYLKAGRIGDAMKSLERVLEIDPSSAESMINLGAIYFGRGDLARAQDLMRPRSRPCPRRPRGTRTSV